MGRYARIMSYFTAEQKRDLYADGLRDQLAHIDSSEMLDHAYTGSRARPGVGRLMGVDM